MLRTFQDPPRVAALILNWRQPELTLQSLSDLRECGYPNLDILVMDNGSGDDSVERLRTARAEVMAFDDNLGYCAAMNLGIEWAQRRAADLVLFLNNDVRLPAGFLDPMVEVMARDSSVACVGPTMLRPDGLVWCQGGAIAFHPNMLKLRGEGGPPAPSSEGPVAVDFMPGACALYRLDEVVAVGGLDESYFMYWEDVELGWQLRDRGKTIVWLPWSRVTHLVSQSSGGGRSPVRKYMCAVNSVRYLKRHGTVRQWFAFAVFELVLWPFTWLGGTAPKAMFAKGRGLAAGLLGRRVTAADVRSAT
ncbi:MAG: glycosyltransferase family 2 protein [Planctomycetota bacterium]